MLLASSLVDTDPARAETVLRRAAQIAPWLTAPTLMMAALRLRQNDADAAAALLHDFLASAVPPMDSAFQRLADAIAARNGRAGWAAVDRRGRVTWSIRRADQQAGQQAGVVTLAVDGVIVHQARSPAAASHALQDGWQQRGTLTVQLDGNALIGSPVLLRSRSAVTGFVEIDPMGDLCGWAMIPAEMAATPDITIINEDTGARRPIAARDMAANLAAPIAGARGFRVAAATLSSMSSLRVVGPDGADLLGSPLKIRSKRRHATAGAALDLDRPPPAMPLPSPQKAAKSRVSRAAGIDIVIPVYDGPQDLSACLGSVLNGLPRGARVVIVDDGSRGPAMLALLDRIGDARVTVLRQPRNMGFPAAANAGMRHSATDADHPRDVVLLNPDTLVAAGWLNNLARAAYTAADIGSVTPMTNDGTITSYPRRVTADAADEDRGPPLLADDFVTASNDAPVTIPTGVGFCMYIRHDCLRATGLFREDLFAQGYGEENDWCFRARHLGWRHVADTSTFVAHAGGRSFGPAGISLRNRNMNVVNRLHPGYDAEIASFMAADPLAPARRRLDTLRWRRGALPGGAVVLVTHDQGGGVARHVSARAASFRAQGIRPIVVRAATIPEDGDEPGRCTLCDGDVIFSELTFDAAHALEELLEFLRLDSPRFVELHHLMGHDCKVTALAAGLGVPLDIYIHDYAMVCPRVTLCGASNAFCGEPEDVRDCEDCVTDVGGRTGEAISVRALRERTAALIAQARQVVVPTQEAGRRLTRYAPAARLTVRPWEDDPAIVRNVTRPVLAPGEALQVCVAGAIGTDKGYAVLLACARDAARRGLNMAFTVVGGTIDDGRLVETGRVFVTGPYDEDEAVALIRRQQAQLGFLPSVWPETWCYTLSALWQAGLWTVAFDLGAQAERIRGTGAGALLPLGLPAARINDFLLRSAGAA